ncbi:hypothetical protein RvY_14630-2 [Ramazzottius varieornatus]|uniref:Secreted protein n=1 Tax=Ramazzottius varieornatus TaxID=947166 RepID=A0A1D1VZ83_RAMVA|nr:hypothetical protein RvY_14630-2 [Ramazzottius varieornatus]
MLTVSPVLCVLLRYGIWASQESSSAVATNVLEDADRCCRCIRTSRWKAGLSVSRSRLKLVRKLLPCLKSSTSREIPTLRRENGNGRSRTLRRYQMLKLRATATPSDFLLQ